MRMPSVKLCAVFLTACALAGPASPSARADFLSNFTGNVQMSEHAGDPVSPQGVVSFTVFSNPGFSDLLSSLGLSPTTLRPVGGSIDFGAQFYYLYQAYADVGPIELLQIKAFPGAFTSAGYLPSTVFNDGANVGNPGNRALGSEPNVDDPTIDGNPATVSGANNSGFKNQTPVAFGTDATAVAPTNASLLTAAGFARFTFDDPAIDTHRTSVVVLLTSNFSPTYNDGRIHDGGISSGDVPTATTPEPGSLVLCGLGVSFLGFYGWRRRGLNAQPAVA